MFPTDQNDNKAEKNLVLAAIITKPHGLKGELRLSSFVNYSCFKPQDELICGVEKYKIESVKRLNKFLIIKFFFINQIEDAEKFRGNKIYLPRAKIINSYNPDNNLLIDDLINYQVVVKQEVVGVVEAYYQAGKYNGLYQIHITQSAVLKRLKKKETRFFVPSERVTFSLIDQKLKKVEIKNLNIYWW